MHTTHALTISPHYVVSFKFWCHSTQMLTCTLPALPHTKQGSYGFVRFKSHADAVRAIVGMNGQVRVQFWPRSGLLLGLLLGRRHGALWASPAVHIAHAAAAAPSPASRIAAAQLRPPLPPLCGHVPAASSAPLSPQALGGKVMKCSWGRHPNTPPSGVQTSLMLAAAAGLNPLAMGSAGGLRGWAAAAIGKAMRQGLLAVPAVAGAGRGSCWACLRWQDSTYSTPATQRITQPTCSRCLSRAAAASWLAGMLPGGMGGHGGMAGHMSMMGGGMGECCIFCHLIDRMSSEVSRRGAPVCPCLAVFGYVTMQAPPAVLCLACLSGGHLASVPVPARSTGN